MASHLLPQEKLAAIRASLTSYLEGLVAVFSQAIGARLLHIYLGGSWPDELPESVEAIRLEELRHADLSNFDGLWAGFSALDVIRPDLSTKGPLFYPLEALYRAQNQRVALLRTMRRLAYFLISELRFPEQLQRLKIRRRAAEKAVEMALATVLARQDCTSLVAVLPDANLSRFVTGGHTRSFYLSRPAALTLKDFTQTNLDVERGWVAGIEELAAFHPSLQGGNFLELRTILRQAGQTSALRDSLHSLALACWTQGEAGMFHPVAWALMVEYWLMEEDVEDLVAFCPHPDFENFAQTGDALRVYRGPGERNVASFPKLGPVLSQETFLAEGLPASDYPVCFSFPVLFERLPNRKDTEYADLGRVLYKAGHVQPLARTFWQLAHDLTATLTLEQAFSFSYHQKIVDMAVRACLFYSLENPWLWRQGRWHVYLEDCYRSLAWILEQIASFSPDPHANYFRTLKYWYTSWLNEDPRHGLEAMMGEGQRFRRALIERTPSISKNVLHQMESLKTLGQWLLHPSFGDFAPPENGHEGVRCPALLSKIACLDEPLPIPFPSWEQASVALYQIWKRRETLLNQEREANRLLQGYHQLRDQVMSAQNLVFAPAHEAAFLELLYRDERENFEKLIRELETAARLTIVLQNPWVDLHEETILTFEVTNTGQAAARNLEIRVASPIGFELLSPPLFEEIPFLEPGDDQPHRDAWTARLNVRSLDAAPFQPKENPYHFGRPIQTPGEFYGRKGDLQNIISRLKGGGKQNLLLRAPRRMGKTSLLYMLRRCLEDSAVRRKFEIPPGWDEALAYFHPVFLSLHSLVDQGGGIRPMLFFRTLLDEIATIFLLSEVQKRVMLETYTSRLMEVGPANAAMEQTNRLFEAHPDAHVVVLLDEYDEIYQPGNSGLDRNLREFVSREQRLTWIIASTLALFKGIASYSSPWFNIFAIHELDCLSKSSALELVENPGRAQNIVWLSDAALALLEETGCHPAFTQLFCAAIIETLNQLQTNYVLRDMIMALADQMAGEQQTTHHHFTNYWHDTRGVGRLILLILDDQVASLKRDELRSQVRQTLAQAFGGRPELRVLDEFGNPIAWWDREFRRGLEWVTDIVNAIDLDQQTRRYTFSVPLFRRWLRRRRREEDLRAQVLDTIAGEMIDDRLAA